MGYDKKINVLGLTICLTDKDRVMVDEEGEEILLSEELGWWDKNNVIWIWIKDLKWYEKLGVGVHEFVELILEGKLGLEHRIAHKVANTVETIITLGKSRVY